MKGEKGFKKAWDDFFSFKFGLIEVLEILGCFLILFVTLIGLSFIMPFQYSGVIAMILFFSLMEDYPFKLKKYTPSGKKRERFRQAYWEYIIKNQDKEGKLITKSYLAGRGQKI